MMSEEKKFPFEIRDLDENEKSIVEKFYLESFVKIGEKRWFARSSIVKYGPQFYNFPLKSDDVWLMGFLRSGTTVVQEIIWLMNNDFKVDQAKRTPLRERFPTFEHILYYNLEEVREEERRLSDSVIKAFNNLTHGEGKRLVKTHMPFGLLPKNFTDFGCKIIYLIRDPRDVVVSNYQIYAKFSSIKPYPEFSLFWEAFKNNLVLWGPYFEHLKEAGTFKDKPNVLIIFYEQVIKNQAETIKKIGDFLGKNLNNKNIDSIVEYCKTQFSKNIGDGTHRNNLFVKEERKWKKFFVRELEDEVNDWMKENLQEANGLLSNFQI